MKRLALSAAILAIATPSMAEVSGPYITGAGLVQQARDADTSGTINGDLSSDIGFGGLAAFGYQWKSGMRAEVEGAYRVDSADSFNGASVNGDTRAISVMGNLLYEFDNSLGIYPFFGGGLGMVHIDRQEINPTGGQSIDGTDLTPAAQAIAGIGFAFTPNLTAVAEYRYFHAFNPEFSLANGAGNADVDYNSHMATLGLRYRFGDAPRRVVTRPAPRRVAVVATPQPAPQPVVVQPATITPTRPVAQAKAAATLRRTYVVFFATDSAVLNSDASAIVQEASARAIQDRTKIVDLTGHTDTYGTAAYNKELSVRRAESAAQMMRGNGVQAKLRIFGKGETDLLVPTADEVREQRNRRVEIVLQGQDGGLTVSER